MSIKNLCKFSFDNMSRNIKKVVIVVLLQVIVFVLIGQVLIEYNKKKYTLNKLESILAATPEKCEALDFGSANLPEENTIEFIKEIYKIKGLLAVGEGCSGVVGRNDELFDGRLRDIQSSNPNKSYIEIDESLRFREIQSSLLSYYNFNYIEKMNIPKEQPRDTVYLLLGNAYKDITVGSEYIKVLEEGFEAHYVVVGILDKGEEFVETSIVEPQEPEIIDCDYEIFIMHPMEDYSYSIPYVTYAIDDNHTVEYIHNEIIRLAEKYGVPREDISFTNAEKVLKFSMNQ